MGCFAAPGARWIGFFQVRLHASSMPGFICQGDTCYFYITTAATHRS